MGIKYDIIESDFQQKDTSAYQLSILVGMDSLVYSVFDTGTKQTLILKTLDFPSQGSNGSTAVAAMLQEERLLDLLYRRVKIAVPEAKSVLVPSRLYNEAEKATYVDELSVEQTRSVQHDELEDLGLNVVYPLDSDLAIILKRRFPTAKVYNSLTPFLVGSGSMVMEGESHQVFLHFFKNMAYVAVFEKNTLAFCNTFPYSSASDVLYFTLLVFEQFSLDPHKIPLKLSGNVLEDSEIFKILYRYVGNIAFLPQPGFLKFGRKFNNVPSHFFFHLHSLSLCK